MGQPLLLFWKIGRIVCNREVEYENAILKYSNLCSYYFGMSETFSINNIKYMRSFYCSFPIYFDELNKLSFEHYKLFVNITDKQKRYFYFRIALFCRSNVEELKNIISNDTYLYI